MSDTLKNTKWYDLKQVRIAAIILIGAILACEIVWMWVFDFLSLPAASIFNITADFIGTSAILVSSVSVTQDINKDNSSSVIYLTLIIINSLAFLADVIHWAASKSSGFIALKMASDSLFQSAGSLMLILFWVYYLERGSASGPVIEQLKKSLILVIMTSVSILLIVLNLFFGFYFYYKDGVYFRGRMFWLIELLYIAEAIAVVCLIGAEKGSSYSRKTMFMLWPVAPVIANLVQFLRYGLSIEYLTSFLFLLLINSIHSIRQRDELIKKDRELAQQKMAIMISQTQPHFIFNSLNTICYLCRSDPKTAERATKEFADYLRTNLDSFEKRTTIPFSKEVDHTKNYLSLEKLRFRNSFDVEWDLEVSDFFIPPISLQPLVENSVKHGLSGVREGGLIRISTYRENDRICIEVADNGCGFDPEIMPADGKNHIGLENVRNRIASMSAGTVEIDSTVGKGSRVRIILPD